MPPGQWHDTQVALGSSNGTQLHLRVLLGWRRSDSHGVLGHPKAPTLDTRLATARHAKTSSIQPNAPH